MLKNTKELERKISLSFHYVKRDMLRLNDSIEDLNKKIQHISLNQALLLEKIAKLEKKKKK